MNWDILTSPTGFGGLGIRDTRLTNLSPRGKLIWSILHEKNKLWVQVITQKYLGNNSIWTTPMKNTAFLTWKSIMKAVSVLRQGFEIKLNAGNSNFWFSDWTGHGLHCVNQDYIHIFDTHTSLRDLWNNGKWCLNLLATLMSSAVKSMVMNIEIQANNNNPNPDTWVWKEYADGTYKASLGYIWLLDKSRNLEVYRLEMDLES